MASKQKFEQEFQVRSSRTYLDNLSTGSGLESPANISLEEDLNSLRTMLRHHLTGNVGGRKWYDSVQDNFGLDQIHDKVIAYFMPMLFGTADFTLGGAVSGVLTPNTLYSGGSGVIAVGPSSTTEQGYIAADESNFTIAGTLGVGLSTALDGDGQLLNEVSIIDADTNEPPQTGDNEKIFGLLQVVTGTSDGAAIAGGGSENLQISFVYRDDATDTITATTLPAGDYHFSPVRQRYFYDLQRGFALGAGGLPGLIDPSTGAGRLPIRVIDITSGPASADDPLNIQTGAFTTAGAQTLYASFGTPALPAAGADFRDDSRIKIWRNGQLQNKGAASGDNRDLYWVSTTQIAFESTIRPNEVIIVESPASF